MNVFKICYKCALEKEHTKKGKICIDCKKAYDIEFVKKNLERLRDAGLEYRKRPSTKARKKRYDKKYRNDNKERVFGNKLNYKQDGRAKDRARKNLLKRKYNLTQEDYERMCKDQNGQCLICNTDDFKGKGNKLYIDHCHKTGKIRGLLCSSCNVGLGNFKENIEALKNAIKYLLK